MASNNQWDGLFDDTPASPPIDSRFTTLVSYNKQADSFAVNFEGVRSIFSTNGPLRVHACIGRTEHNSNFTSKTLEYASGNQEKCESRDSENLTELFSQQSENMKEKCIVAWSQVIPGEVLQGHQSHHAFLDIWGEFEEDDPIYLILAGICTAIASSVVHIQESELESSTWVWMNKVALVASKVLANHPLGRILFFVLDWTNFERFGPGEKGGREYLQTFFEDRSSDFEVQNIRQLFENTSCYLFPVKENSPRFQQHLQAFKMVALSGACDLELSTAQLMKTSAVEELLHSLETRESYVNYMNDPDHEIRWNNAQKAKDLESSLQQERMPSLPTNIFEDMKNEQPPDYLLYSGSGFSLNPADEFPTSFFTDENSDSPLFTVEPQVDSQVPTESEPQFTFQQFLQNQKQGSEKTVDANAMAEKESSSSSDDPEQQAIAPAVNNCVGENIPSLDEILARMNKRDNTDALKDAINIPLINIKIPSGVSKPSTFTAKQNSSQSTAVHAGQTPEVSDYGLSRLPDEVFSSSFPTQSEGTSNLNLEPPRNQPIPKPRRKDFEQPTVLPAELLTAIRKHFDSVNEENLFTVSVDETFNSVKKAAVSLQLTFQYDYLHLQLSRTFSSINSYVETMDRQFKKVIYFDGTKALRSFSKNCIEEILNKSEITIDCLRDVFRDKTLLLEAHYIVMNPQIHTKEIENAQVAIELVLKLYREKTSVKRPGSSEEELSQTHAKWSKTAKEAFEKIYGSSSKELTAPHVATLNEKLVELHRKNIAALKTAKECEANTINTLVQQISARFGSELTRSVMKNASISTEPQFLDMSQTCRSSTETKFTSEISALSDLGQKHLKERIGTELDGVHKKYLMEFRAKQRKPDVKRKPYFPNNPSSSNGAPQNPHFNLPKNVMKEARGDHPLVGIRFGFDQLTAVALVDGNYRNIYGPAPNVLNFSQDEVTIGEFRSANSYSPTIVKLKEVLGKPKLDASVFIRGSISYSVCEVVAMVLSQLHLIVTESLHTTSISYAVAVPTCFTSNMMGFTQDAMQIAGMQGTVIKEACGLLTRFLHQESFRITPSTAIITIVENSDDSADAVCYAMEDRKMSPMCLFGSNVVPNVWLLGNITNHKEDPFGISQVIDKLLPHVKSKIPVSVVLECAYRNGDRNKQIVRRKTNWMCEVYSNSSASVAEGAALFAGWEFNPSFRQDWNDRRPQLNEDSGKHFAKKDCNFRLEYNVKRLNTDMIVKAHETIVDARRRHQDALHRKKEQAKRNCLEVLNNIRDCNFPKPQEDALTKNCSEIMRRIDGEGQSINAVRLLISELQKLRF